ncbi:FUSC family protein [Corynebacterium atypicum]|uniref:FUSC family protein n=1 Tax=Corynebacterium atypicum TaxID=191610 RepID=UPI000A403F52
MVARLGLNPVEVGAWALIGVASAVVIGMVPALVNPHAPERQAVNTLERSVENFARAPRPAVAKKHAAETALQNAWYTLADAGLIRGGRIITDHGTELVARVREAQLRLARLNLEFSGEELSKDLDESPVYVDLTRTAIPHARPSVAYRIYRSIHPYSHATMTASKVLLAALAAGAVGLLFQLDRPDWAVVSVLLTLQWGPERIPGTIRGLHRVIGSIAGIGFFAGLHLLGISGWSLLAVLAVCQFFAEIFVVRNYGFCVLFTTPLALLMGGALTQPMGTVVLSRTAEIIVAIAFALIALWWWLPDAETRHHARLNKRCQRAMGALLGALLTAPPSAALSERRDLQYELLSEGRAAKTLAADTPDFARTRWQKHVATQQAGYMLLDYCTKFDNRELSLEEIASLSKRVRAAGSR